MTEYYTTGWIASERSQRQLPTSTREGRIIGHAYNQAEQRELYLWRQTIRLYPPLIDVWREGIDLLETGLLGYPEMPEDPVVQKAIQIQMLLGRLLAGTAKAALDLTLAGYYPSALSSIRLLMEGSIAVRFLYVFPERSGMWFSDHGGTLSGESRQKSPPVKTMVKKVNAAAEMGNEKARTMVNGINSLCTHYDYCSMGDHVTNETLGLMTVDPSGIDQTYPVFNEVATLQLFNSGLFTINQAVYSVLIARRIEHVPSDGQIDGWPGSRGWFEQHSTWVEALKHYHDQISDFLRTAANY